VQDRSGAAAVTTADGRVHDADVVVDCAGPMTLELLAGSPAGESAVLSTVSAAPTLPQVAYFKPGARPEGRATPPIFIEWGDDMIYGLPVPQGPRGGLYKVSHHTPGSPLDRYDPTDPHAIDEDDPVLLAMLTEAVARLLPGLDPEPVASERCVYDNSADTDFVLDRVGHVVVGSGTSGHGFKFGPLLGELLADLADGTEPTVDLARFGLDRHLGGGAPVGR
jgi:sarcosine oxidase